MDYKDHITELENNVLRLQVDVEALIARVTLLEEWEARIKEAICNMT